MPGDENDNGTKQKKGTWNPANTHEAVERVLSNEMSTRQATDRYQVAATTLNNSLVILTIIKRCI